MDKVNLAEKFAIFSEYWSPYIAGELNGQHVKLAKLKGEFVWHHHEDEDELFLVVKGRFRMEFRDRHLWLEEGEFLVVPRGVEHRPVAEEEAYVLFEPASTLNTGNVQNERTLPVKANGIILFFFFFFFRHPCPLCPPNLDPSAQSSEFSTLPWYIALPFLGKTTRHILQDTPSKTD